MSKAIKIYPDTDPDLAIRAVEYYSKNRPEKVGQHRFTVISFTETIGVNEVAEIYMTVYETKTLIVVRGQRRVEL